MSASPVQILLLEDNPGDSRLIQLTLAEGMGSSVKLEIHKTLSSGIECLSLGGIDLILLDLALPDSEGFETFLQVYSKFSHIPIIVLTGLNDDFLGLNAVKEGAQDYLVKGEVNGQILARSIKYAIERHKLQDVLSEQTKELKVREANLHNLINTNVDAMIIVDDDGKIRFANPAAELLFKSGQEELKGKPFSVNVAEGLVEEITISSKPVDKVFEMRVVKTTWEGGSAYLASLRDITARKRAEAELKESQDRFRVVTTSTLDMICEITPEGHFIYVSPNCKLILGYETFEIIERHFSVFVHPEDFPLVNAKFIYAIQQKEEFQTVFRFKHKNGDWRWFECAGSTYETIKGEFRILTVSRDITERISLEEQFRQSQKMEAIGRLAGGIAHDFNNILTVITGHIELLLTNTTPCNLSLASLEEIKTASYRATLLVRQLLAFSRKQVLEPKIINLNAIVCNLDKMLTRLIGEDITFVTSLDDSIGNVKVDPGQMEQVIINLAVNARDAMPNGGKLTINTANIKFDNECTYKHFCIQAGSYVVITVSDTGCGMDAEIQSHIFEPFFTTKGKEKGTGLGLSTVYGIVKQSGGYIWVDSEINKGSTFKVYLPNVDGQLNESTATEESASTEEIKPTKEMKQIKVLTPTEEVMLKEEVTPKEDVKPTRGEKTVLVIEDEDGVRSLIMQILKRNGYTVLQARDGIEAVEICELHADKINLIISDVVIPYINIKQLASTLTSLCPKARVLYMSGYSDEAVASHGAIGQGSAFLQKPFTTAALTRKVQEMIRGEVDFI